MRSPLAMSALHCLVLAGLTLLAGVGASGTPAAAVFSHGRRSDARVALTFDDGASPDNCRRILAILVSRGVPATFFPVAEAMPADPGLWRMVVAEGDPIGDHTLTHPQMPTLTEAQQFRQIDGARRLAERVSGTSLLRVFRPPYGAYDAATLQAAAAAGFPTILLWDTSDRDTSPNGTVAEMLAAAERATNGSVILMHCGPNATPYVLGPLLDHLRSVGLRPVTVPTLLGLPWIATPAASPPDRAEILDGLSPLPPTSSGGVIIGPSGIDGMTFPPGPAPTSPPRSPTPSVPPVSETPAISSPSSMPAAEESAVPTLSPSPAGSESGTAQPIHPTLMLAVIVLFALLVVIGGILVARVGRAQRR